MHTCLYVIMLISVKVFYSRVMIKLYDVMTLHKKETKFEKLLYLKF